MPQKSEQQTPSEQMNESHWDAVVHGAPSGPRLLQTPPRHSLLKTHWRSIVQVAGHWADPLHRYGLQLGEPALPIGFTTQAPATLQDVHGEAQALSQHLPPTQCPLRHWVPAVQVAPCARKFAQTPPTHWNPGAQFAEVVHVVGQLADIPEHE